MKIFLTLVSLIMSVQAYTDNTSSKACQGYCDYLCRHFRSDLKPVELRLSKRNAGDFYIYSLSVLVKNSGEAPVGDPNGGLRYLQTFATHLGYKTGRVYGQFASQQSKWVGLGAVNPQQIKHCTKLKIQIDTDREFGQFGCVVHANDKRILTVYEAGKPKKCRIPTLKVLQ